MNPTVMDLLFCWWNGCTSYWYTPAMPDAIPGAKPVRVPCRRCGR